MVVASLLALVAAMNNITHENGCNFENDRHKRQHG